MPKYRRAFEPGGTFFFTVTTHGRCPILGSGAARDCLREAFCETKKRQPFSVDAIVLLPDHLHCIWTLPKEDCDFSSRWSRIKARFTMAFLESGGPENAPNPSRIKRGERGIWQRRFYEHLVRDETDLKRCVDYIHINPVKHGLVSQVVDWPWSSFHRYVQLGEYQVDWGNSSDFFGDEWLAYE